MAARKKGDIDAPQVCRTVAIKAHLTYTGHNVLLVSGFHDTPEFNAPTMRLMRV